MNRALKLVLVLLVVAGLGAGGWAVFEHVDRAGLVKDSERACGTLETQTGGSLPAVATDLPSELKVLRTVNQGKTTLVIASTRGKRSDVVEVRDRLVRELVAQGWTKKGTDQEPGFEAEARLGGKADASLRVRPLCEDRLEVRLTIRG